RAAVLSTGDELTTGRIVDTNSSWIADKLFEIGRGLAGGLTVGDHHDRLVWAWRRALELADVVISTGGIGPTADDLTAQVVAELLGVPMVEDAEQAARIRRLFEAFGREMPANNLKQALLPRGAIVIPNALGTAPGYRLAHGAKHLVVLPGVPREMKPMMAETVLPWLVELRGGDQVYLARVFQTFGLTESGLDEMVAGAIDPSEGRVSFRASFPEVSVRVVVHGRPDEARARLEALGARIRDRIGPYVYGEGAVTMEEVVGRLLRERHLTVALAGSCTGGIAGPDGGTPEKPVGTVCFGLAAEAGVVTRRYQLWGTRDWVKLLASQVALDWIRRHALELPLTESRLFRPKDAGAR